MINLGEGYIHSINKEGVKKTNIIKSVVLAVLFLWLFLAISSFIYMRVLNALGYHAEIAKFLESFDLTELPEGDRAIDFMLFLLFPSVYLANKIAFREKMGEMMSVNGKFRIKWTIRCLLFMLPIMVLTILGQNFIDGIPTFVLPKSIFIAVPATIFFTTIQCLGEEMLFRAWALQTFGILFKNKKHAWIIVGFLSSLGFSLIHDPGNFWVGLDLFFFGVLMCLLIYNTGGIEAAVIFHTLNNLTLSLIELFTAEQWNFSAEQQIAPGEWQGSVLSMVLELICYMLLLRYFNRFYSKNNMSSECTSKEANNS